MDSVLRPRDIQARIRSGESPETVAAAAQTSVDKIMVFATPVLAERAYVAQQAQRASVRRRAGDGPIGHLGEAVASRLTAEEVDPESVEWDAWRREDGRWALVADYPAADGSRQASFVFDLAGRYVTAEDDEARRLVGERAQRPAGGAFPTEDQIALGDDAIEVVTGRRPKPVQQLPRTRPAAAAAPEDDEAEATVELGDTARAVRSAPPPSQADWIRTQATDRPAPAPVRSPAPVAPPGTEEALFDAADVAPAPPPEAPEPSPEPSAGSATSTGTGADAEPAPDEAEPQPKPKKAARSKGRASVPSWDEIMFGSGRGD